MALLTEAQAALLAWIVESADGAIHYQSMMGEGDTITAQEGGAERPMKASDLRELKAQGLVRYVSGALYEVTNEGRVVYEQLKNPPPEPPQVGFQPG